MAKVFRVLLPGLAATALALTAGFTMFANSVGRTPLGPVPKADAIVVLTGGEDRVATGIQLVTAGHGRRLLISGVHPKSGSPKDLKRQHGGNDAIFKCCIDIGLEALDTIGNADEARDWAIARGFRSLIVVTSSYHMPRSLAEFSRAMPDVTLLPHPVPSRSLRLQSWWQHQPTARLLVGEYLKFLTSAARLGVSRMIGSLDIQRSIAHRRDEPKSATREARVP